MESAADTRRDSSTEATPEPWTLPFSQDDWQRTPGPVKSYVLVLLKQVEALTRRLERLDSRVRRNSTNSDQPPSSDSPYQKKAAKSPAGRPGAKQGHQGQRQVMLEPVRTEVVKPERCICGNAEFADTEPFYTHQFIELPAIEMEVVHFVLHRGRCPGCGKLNKASLPAAFCTGYGPRFSAVIAQPCGAQADSRSIAQEFCRSVLGIPVSIGAIQKIIDRASAAIQPHYEEIGRIARQSAVNHIDETTFSKKATLQWLWVMANSMVAFFMIHSHRSKEAFEQLVQDWVGILVSDGYGVYCKWVGMRQTCLAHLIRKAKALSESKDAEISRFGKWAHAEL